MLELIDSPPIAVAASPGPRRSSGTARALVTGGSGFLGQHLVAALARRSQAVRIFDLTTPAVLPSGVEYVRGSVLDHATALQALDGITCVYHLAGMAHLWTADHADFDRINNIGTEVMLGAARKMGVGRFLHCSTEVVLLPPQRRDRPIDETVTLGLADMAGPYSRSKYLAEQAAFAASAQGQDVVVVNPTIPVGAGDRNHTPPTAMLAHYLSGSHFFLDCMLNLVDARDIADGMMLAAERGRRGERYVLGGENVPLAELLRTLERICGRRTARLRVPPLLARATGSASEWIANNLTGRAPIATVEGVRLALRSSRFDSNKAARELGYAPRPIEDALIAATRWLINDGHLSRNPGLAEAPVV